MLRLLLLLALATPAAAQTVHGGAGGYQRIARGVFEIGLENILILRQNAQGEGDAEVETLEVSYTGGLTPRFFLMDNFAIGLHAGFFVRKQSVTTHTGGQANETTLADDTGFIGFALAHYFIRLGNSFFFKPGLGVGGFTGTRSLPVPGVDGQKTESELAGLAGRLDSGFAFFASEHMSLRAGLDFIYRSGTDTPAGADEGAPFTTIDGGFNAGIAYVF